MKLTNNIAESGGHVSYFHRNPISYHSLDGAKQHAQVPAALPARPLLGPVDDPVPLAPEFKPCQVREPLNKIHSSSLPKSTSSKSSSLIVYEAPN